MGEPDLSLVAEYDPGQRMTFISSPVLRGRVGRGRAAQMALENAHVMISSRDTP
jgi:hypothetical protein